MQGIGKLTGTAALLFAGIATAQQPVPVPVPNTVGLPGGAVVGTTLPALPGSPNPVPMTMPARTTPPVPMPLPATAPTTAQPPMVGGIPGLTPSAVPPVGSPIPGAPADMRVATPDTGLCLGPVGAHGPVYSEAYLRTGPSFPIGGGFLVKNLNVGWNITGGGRSLFLDSDGTAAWTADLHLSWTYNNASGQEQADFNGTTVTLRALFRTAVGVGVGRDWFSSGPSLGGAGDQGMWRYGFNGGIRLGTGHTDLNPIFEDDSYRRIQDTFWQGFVGVHSLMDIPMGGWNLMLGGRVEWNYTWSEFFPTGGDFQGIDVLATFGIRY